MLASYWHWQVCNNTHAASASVQMADDLEDAQSKEHQNENSNGIVVCSTVSANPHCRYIPAVPVVALQLCTALVCVSAEPVA